MDEYKFLEITNEDDVNQTIRKLNKNMIRLQKDAVDVWHDFQCVDLTNGDRRRFVDWIIDLFLEDK